MFIVRKSVWIVRYRLFYDKQGVASCEYTTLIVNSQLTTFTISDKNWAKVSCNDQGGGAEICPTTIEIA